MYNLYNTIIWKKIQKKLESSVKKENSKSYKKTNNDQLFEKYINFAQIYLKFLISYLIIVKNNNAMNKTFNLNATTIFKYTWFKIKNIKTTIIIIKIFHQIKKEK